MGIVRLPDDPAEGADGPWTAPVLDGGSVTWQALGDALATHP